jgi:hypothetical protein
MRAVGWTLVASSIMGLATYGALAGVEAFFPAGGGLAEVLSVALPAALGGGVYLVLITLFRVEEIHLLWSALRRRLGS